MNSPDLKNILVIDIETVSVTSDYSMLPERIQNEWIKKSQFIKNDENLSPPDLYYSRAAIYAEFGKIICIGAGIFTKMSSGEYSLRVKAFSGEDEKILLTEFKNLVEQKFNPEQLILCAHNGKEFDFPYLCRRMLVNGIALPEVLNISAKKPWEINHLDTMELWKFGDRKNYTSLELLSALFGLPTSKNEMDGSKVNKVYYEEKNLMKIADYCIQDVILTANLLLKFHCLPEIGDQNIIKV